MRNIALAIEVEHDAGDASRVLNLLTPARMVIPLIVTRL